MIRRILINILLDLLCTLLSGAKGRANGRIKLDIDKKKLLVFKEPRPGSRVERGKHQE